MIRLQDERAGICREPTLSLICCSMLLPPEYIVTCKSDGTCKAQLGQRQLDALVW
jgi:hypothetical protein